jgi:hypothetical protein
MRHKKRLLSFLDKYYKTTNFVHLLAMSQHKLKLISRFYKRQLARDRLLMSMMNFQWSLIEYEVVQDLQTIQAFKL